MEWSLILPMTQQSITSAYKANVLVSSPFFNTHFLYKKNTLYFSPNEYKSSLVCVFGSKLRFHVNKFASCPFSFFLAFGGKKNMRVLGKNKLSALGQMLGSGKKKFSAFSWCVALFWVFNLLPMCYSRMCAVVLVHEGIFREGFFLSYVCSMI